MITFIIEKILKYLDKPDPLPVVHDDLDDRRQTNYVSPEDEFADALLGLHYSFKDDDTVM